MSDFAPELLSKIKALFNKLVKDDTHLDLLYCRYLQGKATYEEANELAIILGQHCSTALQEYLNADVLPDPVLYYSTANEIVGDILKEDYKAVTEYAAAVQADLNTRAGIGMAASSPALNESRVMGIVGRLSDAEDITDVSWIMGEPVVNFSQSNVDAVLQDNVNKQQRAGLSPKIVRTLESGCCKWCRSLAGTYSAGSVPQDVYRRHDNCRCTVTWKSPRGLNQDVWSKATWEKDADREKAIANYRAQTAEKNAKETPADYEYRAFRNMLADGMQLSKAREQARMYANRYAVTGRKSVKYP